MKGLGDIIAELDSDAKFREVLLESERELLAQAQHDHAQAQHDHAHAKWELAVAKARLIAASYLDHDAGGNELRTALDKVEAARIEFESAAEAVKSEPST